MYTNVGCISANSGFQLRQSPAEFCKLTHKTRSSL
jgi:hypothetical protein